MTAIHDSIANDVGLAPEHQPLLAALARVVEDAIAERDDVDLVRTALGPDALIPYGTFLKANELSYELGQRLRDEGRLKVLQVGGKLMVRKGHAAEFVRNLPLN